MSISERLSGLWSKNRSSAKNSSANEQTISDEHLLQALGSACELHSPAMIISPDVGVLCRARFSSMSDGEIIFELLSDWAESVFMPQSLCCVIFNGQSRAYTFFSSVKDFKRQLEKQYMPKLVLVLPHSGLAVEARRAFRIPVYRGSGLSVKITTPDNHVRVADPRDISLLGMLVEFNTEKDPDLSVGLEVLVDLDLEGETLTVKGIIRRRIRSSYGMSFSFGNKGETSAVPEKLKKIITLLERQLYAVNSQQRGGIEEII